ncbi:uncharacterized protein LOC122400443 [Colletes gigas]|uniref:uncharacterized protein LOC122400443 n=1 Tax=Colletes gigas TaxID=935657 RepID=UPI001C9B0FBF|nr:uncharacterized protein LOC122400443 [Colletes gigas]
MSPASQGAVEVERYIGSCLISSSLRSGSQKPIVGKKQESAARGKSRSSYGGQSLSNGTEQCHVQYGPGGWTGAPLISMTSSPRRCNQRLSPSVGLQPQQQQQQQACEQQVSTHLHKNPLSRLAIHTQGAPLILAGRFHNRGKIHNTGNVNGIANSLCSTGYVHNNGNAARCPQSRPQRSAELSKKSQPNPKADCVNKEAAGTSIANIDSLSIASDESSGSNNSENSLPRIIKPRKRRKKDRKPANNAPASADVGKHEEQQQSGDQSNVLALKPYAAGCYERYETPVQLRNHRRPPIARESLFRGQEIGDARQRYGHRHVEVKVLDDNRNVVVPVQIRAIPPKDYRHHTRNNNNSSNGPRYLQDYGNLTGCEGGMKDGLGSCQCRYCDPSGLIWDMDQNCYSPFLTGEFCPGHFLHAPLFLSRPTLSVERLFGANGTPTREKDAGGIVLRRSWSDPTSYFSEEIAAPSKDVGVIGDRGQIEGGKRRTLWHGDTMGFPASNAGPPCAVNNGASSPKGLEVSTEIITSPNGHRDLEIKFYSPSPSAPAPEEADEDEDFSDIWSYHESKLQQDFRTLLQAEE